MYSRLSGLITLIHYIFFRLGSNNNSLSETVNIFTSVNTYISNLFLKKTFTSNEKLAGAEALIRWYKDGEVIPPSKFIPLFEKNKRL